MANRYWVGGNEIWDGTAGTKWATTSGGAGGSAVPTSADDVFLDNGAGTGNVTTATNTTSCTCKSLTCTGYIGTLDIKGRITIAGNVTFVAGMTITSTAGTPNIYINATSTLTSNGKTITAGLQLTGSVTFTLADNWNITGALFWGDITTSATLNSTTTQTLTTSGGMAGGGAACLLSGTAKIIVTGGTLTFNSNLANTCSSSIDLQGNVTVGSNGMHLAGGTLTYVSGTITWTGALNLRSGSITLNLNGTTVNTATIANITVTLTSNYSMSGSITVSNTAIINKTASETFTVAGGVVVNNTLGGTSKVILTGGTWSGSNTLGISNDIDLQGNVTISGAVYYNTGTLTYISGTVTTTGSTLSFSNSCTLNTNGITWNNVTLVTNSCTLTLTSNFYMTGLLTQQTNRNMTINKTVSETWTCDGGITVGTNVSISGTSTLIVGGGTINTTNGGVSIDFNIDGNITLGGTNFNYSGGRLKRVSGTVTVGTTNLNISASCTLDTNSIVWYNVTEPNANGKTFTIESTLQSTTWTLGGSAAYTFDGTAGFTVGTFTCDNVGATTINLKESITYTITASLSCYKSRVGSIVLFTSSHASTKAIITMPNNGSNLCNVLASFTRIDASAGRSINSFGGTVTDCLGVNQFFDYKPYAA